MTPIRAQVPTPHDAPQEVIACHAAGITGWLVIDTTFNGLAFGGCRFHPDVTEQEVMELARAMTWKLSIHGQPTGGAKAGIACAPSDPNLPVFLRAFAARCRTQLASSVVIGKDLGATDALIDALYVHAGVPQLSPMHRLNDEASSLPERLRDLTGYRMHMTGLGVSFAAHAALGETLKGAHVAIQGFGLVGAGAALRLDALGAKVVTVSDRDGGLMEPTGLPVAALAERARKVRGIDRTLAPAAQRVTAEDILSAPVDLLVLAATSHSVDEACATTIQAKWVVEGSNFGLTDGARSCLKARGIPVVPDLIASSSSAAMVCKQLEASNQWSDSGLWQAIEDDIVHATERYLAGDWNPRET